MNMSAEIWFIGLILVGFGLLTAGVWLYIFSSNAPNLVVEGRDREVSDCSSGQTTVLAFPFHNRSRRAVQVLGLAPC
jgi:hypothetical protein